MSACVLDCNVDKRFVTNQHGFLVSVENIQTNNAWNSDILLIVMFSIPKWTIIVCSRSLADSQFMYHSLSRKFHNYQASWCLSITRHAVSSIWQEICLLTIWERPETRTALESARIDDVILKGDLQSKRQEYMRKMTP